VKTSHLVPRPANRKKKGGLAENTSRQTCKLHAVAQQVWFHAPAIGAFDWIRFIRSGIEVLIVR
jgi:hypothetical protein